jgi:tetratricopeptide (TPR) repeat protein
VIVLGIGVHLLHCAQYRRSANGLHDQAMRAQEQGKLERTARYLELYLGYVPEDTDALILYGRTLGQLAKSAGDYAQVLDVFERALQREPDHADVRRELVEIALVIGRFSEAREHARILQEAAPGNAELEHLGGVCEEAMGDYARAEAQFEKAKTHAPAQIESYQRLASVCRRQGKAKKADAAMEEMLARNAQSAPAYLAHGYYRKQYGKLEEFAKDVAAARELAADDADVVLACAELASAEQSRAEAKGDTKDAARRVEEGRGYLRRGLQLFPRDPRMYKALATLELQDQRNAEALDYLRRGVETLPSDAGLRWTLAELLIQNGDLGPGESELRRLRKARYPKAPLTYLEACVLLKKKQWAESARVFENVRPQLTGWPTLMGLSDLFLGQGYEQLGYTDKQYAAFRRAVSRNPLWLPACLGLGASLVAMDRIDEAIEEYRKILRQAPQARITMARLLVLRNLRLPPRQRRWQEVVDVLDEAAGVQPTAHEVPILRAEVYAAQGEMQRAHAVLVKARDKQPKEVELWIALARLAEHEGKLENALATLAEAEQKLGDRVELRLARSRFWVRRGTPEAKQSLAPLGQKLSAFGNEERERLLRGLADAYAMLDDPAEAQHLLAQVAAQQPSDLAVRILRFDYALLADKEAATEQILDEMRGIEGAEGTWWRCARACLLLQRARQGDKSGLIEARLLLSEIWARRPGWSRVSLCEAQVEELNGNQQAAINQYLNAIDLGERSPPVIRHTVELLYERGNHAQADEVIRKVQEQTPLLGDLQRLAAEVSFRSGRDNERALALAKKAVADDPKSYRNHLWLAQVLWAVGQKVEAEPALRRALELADNVPETWVALVYYLARTGQREKAEATIREAQNKLPVDRATIALALCYEAIEDKDRARQLYEAALAAKPEDVAVMRSVSEFYLRRVNQEQTTELRTANYEKVTPLLKKLIDCQPKAPADAAWARRALAMVIATQTGSLEHLDKPEARTSYERSRDALAVLGILDRDDPLLLAPGDTAEDARTKAVVLAAQRNQRQRRQAILILEDLSTRQTLTHGDRFLLAQLYESVHERAKAREQMIKLLASAEANPRYPQFLAWFIRSKLRLGETDDAEAWLVKLERLEPTALRTVELKARLLSKQGHSQDAVTLLRGTAEKDSAQVGLAAVVLDQLGQAGEAEKLYRQYVAQSKQPESVLTLSQFLGRQNRLDEALDLCERAWQSCKPETVAQASVVVLFAGSAKPEHCRRVEEKLRAAMAKYPEAAAFRLHLASVYNLQERYDDAEQVYRQALERSPRHVATLNNLAWLLALHNRRGKEALELIERARTIAGPEPGLLDTQAVIYLTMRQGGLAVSTLKEALAESESASAYFHLAWAEHMNKNQPAAVDAWKQAQVNGLTAESLHPLERPTYRELLTEFARK